MMLPSTQPSGASVRFQTVAKSYAGHAPVVRDVSLDIPAGEFCVLLGASGAGKSTLLRMVNGLVTPSAGSVCVDGHAVGTPAWRRLHGRLGMIHQQFNLVRRASVLDNVLMGALPELPAWRAALRSFPRSRRREACALLARVGLEEEHLRRRASELSGGQQQRVGIARAFILGPRLVLADEPVASLDPQTSRDILELLRTASRERGCTVLCSLHQLDLARAFADRIVALRAGGVVFDGPPERLDARALRVIYGEGSAPVKSDKEAGDVCRA